jgi:hypothetical protein
MTRFARSSANMPNWICGGNHWVPFLLDTTGTGVTSYMLFDPSCAKSVVDIADVCNCHHMHTAPPTNEVPRQNGIGKQKLVLVVPFGVCKAIHSWGVHMLAQAVGALRSEVDVDIWDMAHDACLGELFVKHRRVVESLRPWIRRTQRTLTAKNTGEPWDADISRWEVTWFYYASIALSLGDDLPVLIRDACPTARFRMPQQITRLLRAFRNDIEEELRRRIVSLIDSQAQQAVVGISVYDGTLIAALHLGKLIKTLRPEVTLLVGGEAMDPAVASAVCSKAFLDGAVVGFGEDVLLSTLDARKAGVEARSLRLPGFFSLTHFPPDGQQYATQSIVNSFQPASAHRDDKTGNIHIFARRGCGWGRCTFCRAVFRRQHIDADLRATCQLVAALLESSPPTSRESKPIHVRFDNENNDADWLYQFLVFLENEASRRNQCFTVFFWLTARQMAQKENRRLFRPWSRIKLMCTVGIETFNPKTLHDMRKGVDVLTLLMCLKMVHDSGGENRFNYFAFFPLENCDSVREEVDILSKCLHLTVPSKSPVYVTMYSANTRDDIFHNQEQFQVEVRAENDFWLSKAFAVDSPLGYTAASYSLKTSGRRDFSVVRAWFHVLREFGNVLGPLREVRFGGETPVKRVITTMRLAWGSLRVIASLMSLFLRCSFINDFVYARRAFLYLRYLQFPNRESEPRLWLSGDSTVTREEFPGGRSTNCSIELTRLQLSVLRYTYAPRKRTDIIAKFQAEYGTKNVEAAVAYLVRSGLALEWRGRTIALPHDPEALRQIMYSEQSPEVTA